jgi:hypothetical protein
MHNMRKECDAVPMWEPDQTQQVEESGLQRVTDHVQSPKVPIPILELTQVITFATGMHFRPSGRFIQLVKLVPNGSGELCDARPKVNNYQTT